MSEPIIALDDVSKLYGSPRKGIEGTLAVDRVSLELRAGETLGLVGSSGSGKSTLGRMMTLLEQPTSGRIRFRGEDTSTLSRSAMRSFRRTVQPVFQDPYSSLNPTMSVAALISEPWRIHGTLPRRAWSGRVDDLLDAVGLSARLRASKPGALSGGQRQRVGIARALALEPEVLICDEPVSALDVSVQAQILVLLKGLQESFGLACVFITHDMTVVSYIAQRVAVMKSGRIVEIAPTAELFSDPREEFTRTLIRDAKRLHGDATG